MDIVPFGMELIFKFHFYFFVHNNLFEVSVYEATGNVYTNATTKKNYFY